MSSSTIRISAVQEWQAGNQRYLMARLRVLRSALARHIRRANGSSGTENDEDLSAAEEAAAEMARDIPGSPALDTLCAAFALSPFERDVLLLCAGMELDSSFPQLCGEAQGSSRRRAPTFSLALAALPDAHWNALTPVAPLRRWRLVELGQGDAVTTTPLRIDERVLHYLAGLPYFDARLHGMMELLRPSGKLPPSHAAIAERIVACWSRSTDAVSWPVIQLCGEDEDGKREVAAEACAACGLHLRCFRASDLPVSAGEREAFARLWEREAVLEASALLVDCDIPENARSVLSFIENVQSVAIVTSSEPLRIRRRPAIRMDVQRLSPAEQRSVWQQSLGNLSPQVNGQIEALVSQFSLSTETIRAAIAQVTESMAGRETAPGLGLWDACRLQARQRLDDLAQRIEPAAGWSDLVLPDLQLQTLRDIASHVRRRSQVYETWGFALRGSRGLGISALFAGSSGTGKTMAAEVLAHELNLDLYRIDLSQVVSKYIGETEKNLRRVFRAAEEAGAILLFDEADALFGKRTEVKDSHDRYANIEVSYLLQGMEAYRGLAILTTNMKSMLDPAFLRRIRFVVQFPFPDVAQRTEIWRHIFPPNTPTQNLDVHKLARLNVAGGNIRNIALHAAFLAADAGESVRMTHLLRAARGEYAKIEKPLTEAESGGWV